MKNKYVLYCGMAVVSLGGGSLCPAASKAARKQDTQAHFFLATYDALLKSLSLYPTVQEIFKQIHSLPVSGDRSLYRAYVQLIIAEMAEQNMPADFMKAIMQFNKRMVPRSKGSWWKRADVWVPIAASLVVAGIGAWYVWSNRKTKLKGPGPVQRGVSHASDLMLQDGASPLAVDDYSELHDAGSADVSAGAVLVKQHEEVVLPHRSDAGIRTLVADAGSGSDEETGRAGAGSSDAEVAAHPSLGSAGGASSVVTVEDFNTQLGEFSKGEPAALAYFIQLFTPIEIIRGNTVEWFFKYEQLHTIQAEAVEVIDIGLELNRIAVADIKNREEATKTGTWYGMSTYNRLPAGDPMVQAIIDRYVLMYYVVYYMRNARQGRLIWTKWGTPEQIKESLAPILTLSQSGAIIDALVQRLKFSAQTVAWGKRALSVIQSLRQTDLLIDPVQKNLQQFCGISDAQAAQMARASKTGE
ncbi:MAG: hypothetical protein WCJ17_03540 [bacterium]